MYHAAFILHGTAYCMQAEKMAEEHHIPVLKEVWCDNRPAWRFKESPQLDFLEQNLYRYNGKIWKNDPQDIQIFRGKNPAEETEYVCSCINEKVQKEGMRYRDLAVVTGDLASYGKEIAHRFDEAGSRIFWMIKRVFWKILLSSL